MDATPPAKKSSLLALSIQGTIALVISAATLWWAFHDVDVDNLRKDLSKTTASVIVVYFLGQFLMHGVRVVRWGILIRPLGKPSWRLVFSSASIGIPAAFFIPLRLGEFVRPAICARAGLPFGGAMAAVAAERIADGVFNVGLFFLFLRMLPEAAELPPELVGLSNLALVGFGGGVLFLIAAYFARTTMIGIVRKILSPISANVAEKVALLIDTFIDGLAALNSLPRFLGFIFTTCLFWGLNGFVTWILAESYVEALPLLAGPFTISVTVFAVMIPAGPAFAGTLEAGFRLGLLPFGVAPNSSAVIAVVAHMAHLVFMAAIAGAGFLTAEPKVKAD